MKKAIIGIDIVPGTDNVTPRMDALIGKAKEFQQTMKGSLSGGGRGGSGGGGKSGGTGNASELAEKRAMLNADMQVAQAQKNINNQYKTRAELIGLGRKRETQGYVDQKINIAKNAKLADDAARKRLQATQKQIGMLKDEARMLDRIASLEKKREADLLKYQGNPAMQKKINTGYDRMISEEQFKQSQKHQREAARQARMQAGQKPQGFLGSIGMGWDRAGGFGAAIGTIAKFTVAYKLFDYTTQAVTQSTRMLTGATIEGAKAWISYEEEMAKASRTFRQAGFERGTLKEVLGQDALKFLKDYRTTLKEIATVQYELGSANLNASQIMQAYQQPLKLSIALGGDVVEVTRLMTQMYKIHGDQMGDNVSMQEKMVRISGMLYRTWDIEQLELSDMIATYKYLATTAKITQLSLEEVMPLMGIMSRFGLRGSIAGTSINQFVTQLAKNFRVDDNDIATLEKNIGGGKHKIKLDLKPGDVTVTGVMGSIIEAMTKEKVSPADMLRVQGIIADFFNIRGARAIGAMVSDTKLWAEYMKQVAMYSGMTSKEMGTAVEDAVKIMQLTPSGQWDIMANKSYVIGVNFFRAAVGADDLVGAMVKVNNWLDTLIPKVDAMAASFRIMAGGMSGALQGISQNWEASGGKGLNLFGRLGFALSGGATGQITGSVGTYNDSIVNQLRTSVYDKIGEGLLLGKSNETIKMLAKSEIAAYQPFYPNIDFSSINIDSMIKDIKDKKALQDAQIQQKMNQYNFEPTGTGSGGGSQKYKKGDIVEGYKISAGYARTGHGGAHNSAGVFDIGGNYLRSLGKTPQQVMKELEEKGYLVLWERKDRGQNSTGENLHVVTPGTTADKWVKWVAGQKTKYGQWTAGSQDFREQYNQMPAQVATNKARDVMSYLSNAMTLGMVSREKAMGIYGDIVNQRGEYKGADISERATAFTARRQHLLDIRKEAEDAKKAQEDALTLRGTMGDFFSQRGSVDRQRAVEGYSDKLAKVQKIESLYGETIGSVNQKIGITTDLRMSASSALEREEAILSNLEKQYNALYALNAQNMVSSILGVTPKDAEKTYQQLEAVTGKLDSQRDKVKGYRSTIDEATSSLAGFNLALADIAHNQIWDKLNQGEGIIQAIFMGKGANYEMSDAKIGALQSRIRQFAADISRYTDLSLHGPAGSYEMYQKKIAESLLGKAQSEGELERIVNIDRGDWLTDMVLRINDIRAGWVGGGSGKKAVAAKIAQANASLAVEVQRMQRDYADFPDAQGMIAKYEATMKAENIARPWIDAKTRIEGEWTDMFSNVFSELASGGNPFRAMDSIVKSFQGQMISGFVKKNFSGLFETLASDETGIAKSEVDTAMAGLTVTSNELGLSMTQTTAQVNTFGMALSNVTSQLMMAGDTLAMGGSPFSNFGADAKLSIQAATAKGTESGLKLAFRELDKSGGSTSSTGKKPSKFNQQLALGMKAYSASSMWAGMAGDMLGYDAGSAGVAGGLGYAAATLFGANPVVAGLVGLASIFGFGKKKKKPQENDPARDMYGMPAFEWESYLYNYGKWNGNYGNDPSKALNKTVAFSNNVGSINININGGDSGRIGKEVEKVIQTYFGPVARSTVSVGYGG